MLPINSVGESEEQESTQIRKTLENLLPNKNKERSLKNVDEFLS